jgi:SsrA-binding protein
MGPPVVLLIILFLSVLFVHYGRESPFLLKGNSSFLFIYSEGMLVFSMKIVAQNRKAYHDFTIEETLEAGMLLTGTEVKSLRDGKANLKDSYVIVKDSAVFLLNCHISPYTHGNIMNHDPLRTRKLLLHKKEITRIQAKAAQKGYSLIPLKIYFKGSHAKVEIGLARGKKQYEKRDSIKKREADREIERAMKSR